MKVKWGIYNCYPEREKYICTDDLENLKKKNILVETNVYQFIKTGEEYNILIIGGEKVRIKDEITKELPEPKYKIGEKVYIKEGKIKGVIRTYIWHFSREEYYYLLYVNGKKKSRRYFEDELEKVEDIE